MDRRQPRASHASSSSSSSPFTNHTSHNHHHHRTNSSFTSRDTRAARGFDSASRSRSPFPVASSSTPSPLPPPRSTNSNNHSPTYQQAAPLPQPPHHQHQRRESDISPYPPSLARRYPSESGHARAQSASALPSARDLNRAMPPPNSPPGPGSGSGSGRGSQPPPPHNMSGYGPPLPRAPPVSIGPSNSLPSPGSGHPARAGSVGSSMSISSMLGGPPPASRDPHTQQQYASHPAQPGSGSGFGSSVHASPRMHSAAADYSPFRRPQTPDHQRPYERRGPSASSPRNYSTPDSQRYGTPQNYHQRQPSAPADAPREHSRNLSGPPQPLDSGRGPALGPDDRYGRRDEHGRSGPPAEYNQERFGLRPLSFDDRYRAERDRAAEVEFRDRERRDRAYSGSESSRPQHDLGPRDGSRNTPQYGRPQDTRDPRDPRDSGWGRQAPDASYRAPMGPQRHPQEYPPSSQYPPSGPPYHTSPPDRFGPTPNTSQPHPGPGGAPQPYGSPERSRFGQQPQQQAPPRSRPGEDGQMTYGGTQGPSLFDPARGRGAEDPLSHQRNLLAIQDINRRGRISPLPQAVQGAQPQQHGPAGEPGIKSEFGRMFSGIGSGVSAIGVSSPTASGAPPLPYTNASLARRDEEGGAAHHPDVVPDASSKGPKGGRRKKLKEEDARDDDVSGRLTPSGKGKRSKVQSQQQQHQFEPTSAPTQNSFKSFKGSQGAGISSEVISPSIQPHGQRPALSSSAKQSTPAAPTSISSPAPAPVLPPKPKTIVSSSAVLDEAVKHPRQHLGDFIYEPGLTPGRLVPNNPTNRGFSSNPKPLPWQLIQSKINCTLTVKVARVHLSSVSREEITARSYLWGTDVYTDDSDVVAACIHSGWIKGEWEEHVDVNMLETDGTNDMKRRKTRKDGPGDAVTLNHEGLITSPPPTGPMKVPAHRDLHINVVILPRLVKYGATTRHGISSREFGGEYGARHSVHDGLSFMIQSMRWVENGAQPQARLRGKARRERMRKAMREVNHTLGNIAGSEREQEKEHVDRLRGEITGSWLTAMTDKSAEPDMGKTQGTAAVTARDGSEGDKENRPEQNERVDETAKDGDERTPQDKDVDMADAASGTKEVKEAET